MLRGGQENKTYSKKDGLFNAKDISSSRGFSFWVSELLCLARVSHNHDAFECSLGCYCWQIYTFVEITTDILGGRAISCFFYHCNVLGSQ